MGSLNTMQHMHTLLLIVFQAVAGAESSGTHATNRVALGTKSILGLFPMLVRMLPGLCLVVQMA